MPRRLSPLALIVLAVACEVPAEEAVCGRQAAAVSQGIYITAHVSEADSHVGGALEASCATYTLTQPGSAWMLSGTTPAGVALSPGEYIVQLDWYDDGEVYLSEPVSVTVGRGSVEIDVELFAE